MKIHILILGELQENCYVIETNNKNCVIIDPGFDSAKIVREIETLGLVPKAVLFTHGHYDHFGGLAGVIEVFPETEIYIGRHELKVIDNSSRPLVDKTSAEIIKSHAKLVNDGDVIKIDNLEFKVMHTPGHTEGGVVYICENVMFSGDTLFYNDIGRCDLFTGDFEVMLLTLKKIANLTVNYKIYPGHDRSTDLFEEVRHNQYIKMALTK